MNPGRLLVALVVAASVVAGGIALERVLGSARPAPQEGSAAGTTDAWFCPHGGGEGWRAWMVLSNPGGQAAAVSVTTHGLEEPRAERFALEPGRQRLLPVPASPAPTATSVESFDAEIAAGMIVARPRGAGLAAEPCARRAATRWFVPDGTTVRGHRAQVVVMNPTSTEAVVDVALVKDDETVEPARLEGVVMLPDEVVALDLGEVALGERTVTAVVSASLGKVVVAGVGSTGETIRSVIGVTSPARRAVLQGSVDSRDGELVVVAPAGDAPLVATAVAEDAPKPLLEDAAVEEGTAERFGIEAGDVTVVVEARGTGPFVAGRRLPARTGAAGERAGPQPPPAPTSDDAATAGAPAGAAAWVVPSPLPPEGGRSLLSLHNTGTGVASVSVSILTSDGLRRPAGLEAVDLPAGRTVVVGLTEVAQGAPVTALVEASAGEVVATQTGVSDQGYAVVAGVPWTSPSTE